MPREHEACLGKNGSIGSTYCSYCNLQESAIARGASDGVSDICQSLLTHCEPPPPSAHAASCYSIKHLCELRQEAPRPRCVCYLAAPSRVRVSLVAVQAAAQTPQGGGALKSLTTPRCRSNVTYKVWIVKTKIRSNFRV